MPRPFRSAARAIALATAALALPLAAPAAAKKPAARSTRPAAAAPAVPVKPGAPRLILAISVDQLSSDLFEQYRAHYTGGLARMMRGAAFPSGYQGHAATETCPGHSTLLTGTHPARNGIIANSWMAKDASGKLVEVYCAEDEGNKPASGKGYTASAVHLLVPTLGERIKAVWPAARNVAVSGKDRAALMMGGHNPDAVYWLDKGGFATLAGRTPSAEAQAANAALAALITQGAPAFAVPEWCAARDRAIVAGTTTVGNGRFELKPGDVASFGRSPRMDDATVALAEALVDSQQLGRDAVPDVLSVSLSATDYIGHAMGTNGLESCIQLAALDSVLGRLFATLDARGIDYLAVLSADHGGVDLPERASQQGQPRAHRIPAEWAPAELGKAIAGELGIAGPVFAEGSLAGDVWFDTALSDADRARATAALKARAAASGDLAAVFTAAEVAASSLPTGDPRTWSLLERARASYYAGRSGDLVVMLAPQVSPIAKAGPGRVSTHGSPWDYDRRVPMLFWRKGMAQFEQPMAVETVDIAPTLAATIGLPVKPGEMDGRCLDLDSGEADSCAP